MSLQVYRWLNVSYYRISPVSDMQYAELWKINGFYYSPIVPLDVSLSTGPNVVPLSVLILTTGSSLVELRSHHVIITLLPSAAISALIESAVVVLLRLILSANVIPLSLDDLNNSSELLFGVFWSLNQTMYTLSPEIAIGDFLSISTFSICSSLPPLF